MVCVLWTAASWAQAGASGALCWWQVGATKGPKEPAGGRERGLGFGALMLSESHNCD